MSFGESLLNATKKFKIHAQTFWELFVKINVENTNVVTLDFVLVILYWRLIHCLALECRLLFVTRLSLIC